jgi:DNA-binding MarR family transcriptional regulator
LPPRVEPVVKHERRPSATGDGVTVAPDFVLEQHLFFWFTQLLDRRDRQLAAALKADGLRAPDWRILATLHSRHRLSMSELADLTSIDRTTLSRVVERMARAGWVMRLTDANDARVTRLALTASGERLFARIWPAVWRVNETAVAHLPEPAVGLVSWALQQMCRNLDTSVD